VFSTSVKDSAHSWATSEATRRSMRSNRRRDTSPELRLRRALHALGYRYRVDYVALSGSRRRVDLAFTKRRVAVLVHGCYWHGCPTHYTPPKKNAGFWAEKVQRNRARDHETEALLASAGWTVVTVWEHEELDEALDRVVKVLESSQV
jgi:DNA mismatch endonuclease (patch repair protein)